jgi:hypothetical protein
MAVNSHGCLVQGVRLSWAMDISPIDPELPRVTIHSADSQRGRCGTGEPCRLRAGTRGFLRRARGWTCQSLDSSAIRISAPGPAGAAAARDAASGMMDCSSDTVPAGYILTAHDTDRGGRRRRRRRTRGPCPTRAQSSGQPGSRTDTQGRSAMSSDLVLSAFVHVEE